MIVSRLLGGLGNQLFQYAVARNLAARHETELKLDTSSFETYSLRSYALDHFRIEGAVLSCEERRQLGLSSRGRFERLLARLRGAKDIAVIKERSFEFDSTILGAPKTCYLEGYWQSPRYFAEIESKIRAEFVVRDPLQGPNLETFERISAVESVAVHVRCGDYLTDTHTNRYHGTCSPDYYLAAETLLRNRLGALNLFVFSDDPDWVRANVRFASPTNIVRHNGPERDYEDLRLMTFCHHHIIANSTFSWWGAWLCQHAGKIVIAPKNWFREAGHRTDDLIPTDWIRM